MEYKKPEIARLGQAVETIQGQKGVGDSDNKPNQNRRSIAAYEADE